MPIMPERARPTRAQPQPGDADALRLLICNICQTIEELPSFDGDSDDDVLLAGLVTRHGHRTISMFGQRPDMMVANVWRADWHDEQIRKSIIEQIRKAEGHTGLDDEFYASRDTYREEATKCYSKHGRPELAVGCIDYRTTSKLLGNTLLEDDETSELTDEQRKNLFETRQKIYLCDFCPYNALVLHVINERND